MIFNKYKTLISLVFLISVSSCVSRNTYQRPNEISQERIFRADYLPQDSLSTGAVSWKEIFTDAILQKHIEKALENNLDIRMAIQNMTIAQAYLKQAKSSYFPTATIGPDYTMNSPSLNSSSGQNLNNRVYINQFDITANIGWEIDIWGKLKSAEKAQMAQYLGTVAAQQNVKSNLVAAVASNYYLLLSLDEQKKIIEENIILREKNLETTKALKQAGTLTEVATKQSEALVYNAKSSLLSVNSQIEILENTLSLLMGEAPNNIARSTLITQQLPNEFKIGYPTQVLSNRPDVRQAELNLMNAFELTNNAKAQFYPSLKISASAGLQSLTLDNFFSAQSLFANVAAGLLQPIFNKRQIKTNYEVSLANKENAYLGFRKSLLTAGKEVSDAMSVFSIQDEFITLKMKELEAYNTSVLFAQELVNYGMANYLEVLNADVNRLNTQLNIANARYTKLNAGVQLYKALGGGWR
ncbi:MAG: efflux transporter outer membrane subunit [Bacteroidetes bacterium]|nr:efflux transporter outer membrane subunit [Bacteroidota bacterium]